MRALRFAFTLIELLVVVAIIAILAAIAIPNFLNAQVRSKVSRVRSDLRTTVLALESYYVDFNQYPAASLSKKNDRQWAGINDLDSLPENDPARNVPTFRRKRNQNDPLVTLTTPIAYLTSFARDSFATTPGLTFTYAPAGVFSQAYLMRSYGPDNDQRSNETNYTPPNSGNPGGSHGSNSKTGGDVPFYPSLPVQVETTFFSGMA